MIGRKEEMAQLEELCASGIKKRAAQDGTALLSLKDLYKK